MAIRTLRTEVQIHLDANQGVASVPELLALGFTRDNVTAWVRDGLLVRLRRDALVDAAVWNATPPWERHAVRARAVMRTINPGGDGPIVLSHHSALAIQEIPIFGTDERVHTMRTDGRRGNQSSLVRCHRGWPGRHVIRVGNLPVIHPARACLQVAASFGVESGLVSADAGLRQALFTREDLARGLGQWGARPGRPAAAVVVEHATGLSESPGETRSRWLMRILGMPEPTLQVNIMDPAGRFVGRVDMLVEEHRTIIEFDGLTKYADVTHLRGEKVREDRLRELGFEVVRLTWADLANPALVKVKIERAFARAALRRAG